MRRSKYLLPFALLLALAASSLAATKTYVAQAGAIPQVDSITVANTWAAADTASVVIGNSTLTVTMGSSTTTTSQVADAIKRAINATRIDENLVADESRNGAGQLIGEFRDVEAIIDPANSSRVLVRSVTPGVPFGTAAGGNMTVTEVTAGSGTVTRASVQSATGPWHWNNVKNWDTGSVPVNDDIVVFRGTNNGPKFALPNGSLEVTFLVYQDFTGTIGLPLLNPNGYTEYRYTHVRLDDSGTGTDIAHRFGLGQNGTGSPLINIKHSTLKCSPVVYKTGTPTVPGGMALNLCCTANTSTLTIQDGSVDYSSQDGGTSAFVTVTQTGGQSRGISALKSGGATLSIGGGTAIIGGSSAIAEAHIKGGGTALFENQTGDITECFIFDGGTVQYASSATISTLAVFGGGSFDARFGAVPFTLGTTILYDGSKFLDPYARKTIATVFYIYYDPNENLQLGATPSDPIGVVP